MTPRIRAASGLLTVGGLAVGLVGCGRDDTSAAVEKEAIRAGSSEELAEFYAQAPEWAACPELPALQCAEVTVPLDYDDPSGDQLQLAVNRYPAIDTAGRLGSLIVNPGGPGASGVDFVFGAPEWVSTEIHTRYDIVGFDPRGVARSSPVVCMDDAQRDEYYATGLVATGDGGEEQVDDEAEAYADSCDEASGELLPHLGTENVAADLDVLRAVVGDQKLNYLGISYGTLVGQHYADRFPGQVGRMVLDSVMDPKLSTSELVVDNAESFDQAYEAFLTACVAQGCPLGADVAAARTATEELLDEADEEPLAVADQADRPVTNGDMRTALQVGLMSLDERPALTEALAAAQAGDGAGLRALADQAHGFDAEAGTYSNSDLAHTAVVCLWTPDDQRDDDTLDDAIAAATDESAIFGPLDVFRPCSTWAAPATLTPEAIEAPGTPEILLLNNARDPATPLKWAQAVDDQLANAVLLVNEGDGHGAFLKGACTQTAVLAYLLAGSTPAEGTTCQDNGPTPPAQQ